MTDKTSLPLKFLLILVTVSLVNGQRIYFEKYNNEIRRTDESNPQSLVHYVSHLFHEVINDMVYYYYEFLSYFGIVEEIPEQVILRFASTQSPVTYLTKPTTSTSAPDLKAGTFNLMDSVVGANGQVNFQNGEPNVILNNEVLNNLPLDLKMKLLNNKNLTNQLMHMGREQNKDNNQYLYDEKDYTEPAGRDY